MIKIFTGIDCDRVAEAINDYAKENNLRIISTSLAITKFGYNELFYFSVAFEENK